MNPITDELSDEAKAELAAQFAALKLKYPPVTFETFGGYTFTRTIQRRPWQL